MLPHFSKQELLTALKIRKGIIPVHIIDNGKKIIWIDMEEYHFYEGFLHKSLTIYTRLKNNLTYSFTTEIEVLRDNSILTDNIYPTGFIFHAGRCGSTLLSKVLSRSRENLVISEAHSQNFIWNYFTANGKKKLQINEDNKMIYKNLILAMGRHRLNLNRNYFIKFTSFNIRFFDFINSVFPDVKAIFLSRNIDEIMLSWKGVMPGWMDDSGLQKILNGNTKLDLKGNVAKFLEEAKCQPVNKISMIDYEFLKKENLIYILDKFNVNFNKTELHLMQSQFSFDSKKEFNTKLFKS